MYEMLEIIGKIIFLLGLFYFAWRDYKSKQIQTGILSIFGMSGIFLQGAMGASWTNLLGMLVGGILLVIAVISRESIGLGDGMLFLATGTFLSFSENMALLIDSLLLVGIYAITCLVLKKKGKKDRVAFAPFVLAAYVLFVL